MKIYMAADHRGHAYKLELIQKLREKSYDIIDVWDHEYDSNDDNPDAAAAVVEAMRQDPQDSLGVLICGSGIGVSIAANRYPGIYCMLGHDIRQVEHGRTWDHANVLALGSEYTSVDEALQFVETMVRSKPSTEERMLRRKAKIDAIAASETT